MAATQAESQRNDASLEQNSQDQLSESRNALLQNGTDKSIGRVPPDGIVNTKSKSPMSADTRDGADAPGHDRGGDRPPPDQYGQYRYPEGADPYYSPRPGFPGKPRPPPPQQRFFPGQAVSQAPGPTPTLNSLLQSSGAPPQRYPNSYEQPPAGYGPAPGWPPPRHMPPYNPQGSPYRNSTASRGAAPYGGAPYAGPPGPQQPPGAYGPPGAYPQRYAPPGPPNSRPPFSPHQGYERGGSPQPPPHPSGAPSPGPGPHAPALSPNQDAQHPPHSGQLPPHLNQHGQPPPHQGYPPPPRPAQPSTPNTHDPDNDLTGQNSNDSGGSGGAGRSSTPHLRPTPSPTGSSGSRSMSPAVGTQNVAMPPRPSSSLGEAGAGPVRPAGPGAPAPAPQPYAHHGYKPPHYPPQAYPYPPRNHHPYPYAGYRPPPPQHYPPLKQQSPRNMGPPSEPAMGPPTAPPEHDNGPAPPATALVTTGPDAALDEGSQQSTLSNASAASGEESCGTPKARKDFGPGSAAPSPSPHHDDYDAPPAAWPRPPSSPVFNSHIPPEPYRSKAQKSDSLGKLFEMDDSPERRSWLERLFAFMEERRTPIGACPTISKQPLDLYRLYLLVRERGGFVEVTKNKTWKDIAGTLGIGASSSAAYTLRKHYTKNLLAYECHFDRGGIDPQPIINQVEASTKKKSGKANNNSTASSSNTQESFPPGGAAGAPGAPMDGYGNQYSGYPPQQNQSQGYQQGYGYEYGSPYPANRPVYPPYGPEGGDRGYNNSSGEYRYGGGYYRAGAPPPAGTPPPAQPYPEYYRAPPPHAAPHAAPAHAAPHVAAHAAPHVASHAAPPPHDVPYGGAPAPSAPNSAPNAVPNAGAPAGSPRRHPDFAGKEGARFEGARFGWGGGFRASGPAAPWRPPQPTWPAPAPYHQPPQHAPQPGQPNWAGAPGPRPATEQFPPTAAPAPGTAPSIGPAGQIKRELTFPPDCVEATVPSGEKRRRLTKADVAPVDAWRIVMALKSGLLAETCWALDVLNILLFDDTCVGYFGLQHMPGLLELLLEHFQRAVSDVFDAPPSSPRPWYRAASPPPTPPEPAPPPLTPPDVGERVPLLHGDNYTLESRRRCPVTVRDDVPPAPAAPVDTPPRPEHAVLEPWQLPGDLAHLAPSHLARLPRLPVVRFMGGRRDLSPDPPPDVAPPAAVTPAAPPADDGDNLDAEPMDLEREPPPPLEIRDPAGVLKRRKIDDYEDECYTRDEPSLNVVTEAQEELARRCIALSNILRGLTFVPGNELELSRSSAFLALAGRLLLLHHEHAPRAARARAYDRGAERDACCSSLRAHAEWWWDTLEQLREDALVACANVAGAVELSGQPEAVARPLLDGLLHWAVCGAAVAGDAPPHAPASSPLSPRRLALEALCKLCVTDANVDLVLATPPRERISALCASLARDLCRPERPVVREFAVNLLHYIAGAGSGAAREVALHAPAVSQLLAFIERAEQAAMGVANQHGVSALRDNPDAMGTSLDMLRRAAATLARLAQHPHNRPLLRRHERRLLTLVMSQILDQKVAHELADVLYLCSRPDAAPH